MTKKIVSFLPSLPLTKSCTINIPHLLRSTLLRPNPKLRQTKPDPAKKTVKQSLTIKPVYLSTSWLKHNGLLRRLCRGLAHTKKGVIHE
jgi:hypothetical protein